MAKYFNNKVKTGRVAGSVFAIRNGVTIERAYQPVVANPKSVAQEETRAKFKLVQQLATVVSPYIAMRREGLVSSRNKFVRVNYPKATYANGTANLDMLAIDMTNSAVALPAITATRGEGNVSVALAAGDSQLNRVVYVAVVRQTVDNMVRVTGTAVATVAGADNTFATTVQTGSLGPTSNIYVYAYGMRDNNKATKEVFSNLEVTAENVARVIVTRSFSELDFTITETKSVVAVSQ